MNVDQRQAEQLSEMKLSRLEREYKACLQADSKASKEGTYSAAATAGTASAMTAAVGTAAAVVDSAGGTDGPDCPATAGYSRLPPSAASTAVGDNDDYGSGGTDLYAGYDALGAAVLTAFSDNDKDDNDGNNVGNNSNSDEWQPMEEEQVEEGDKPSSPAESAAEEPAAAAAAGASVNLPVNRDSIAPLSESAATEIKQLVSGFSRIRPPEWAPRSDDGGLDAGFDSFVAQRVNNRDAREWVSIDDSDAMGGVAGTGADDADGWEATFSDLSSSGSSSRRRRKIGKRKRKKRKKKNKVQEKATTAVESAAP